MAKTKVKTEYSEEEAKQAYELAQQKHQSILTKKRASEFELELAEAACDEVNERVANAENELSDLQDKETDVAEAATEAFKILAKIQIANHGRVIG